MTIMNMINVHKEESNTSLKGINENLNKKWKEIKRKTVQYLKVETESGKRIQTEETLEIKNLKILTGATEISFSNQTQEMEESLGHWKHNKRHGYFSQNISNIKNSITKHPGNIGHYENPKSNSNRNRGWGRNTDERHRKYVQ